jgi:CRP-like cAMP-binding protein
VVGDVIIWQETTGDLFYVLEKGAATVFKYTENGNSNGNGCFGEIIGDSISFATLSTKGVQQVSTTIVK